MSTPEKDKRKKRIVSYVNSEELSMIDRAAEHDRRRNSDFIRYAVLLVANSVIKEAEPAEMPA